MNSEQRPPSRVWSILLGLAAGLVLVVAIVLLVMFVLGGMTRVSAWYLSQIVLPVAGLVALLVAIVYLIARRRRPARGAILVGGLGLLALMPVVMLLRPATFPASAERTIPAATIRLPSDAPLTVAWGGDSVKVNAHAATPDQRWAYDLLVAPYFSGSANLADYGCYGVEVLAPTAGEVIVAHDGEPEETPGTSSNNFTAPRGNYVVIRLSNDTYLTLAHLKTGSVAVAAGDEVSEGQPIGQCGNSGNTSEPHIHIHLQRQDPREYPLNYAEGLPLYFRDHVDASGNPGPAMPSGGFRLEGEQVIALGPTLRHAGE